MSGNCCDGDAHEHFDATLSSCCQREREEQERIHAYKQTLSLSDPTTVRRRIVAESVVRHPGGHSHPEAVDPDTESDLSGSSADDSEDQVLEMLRRQRLDALRRGSEHAEVHPGVRVLDELEDDVLGVLQSESAVLCALIQPAFPRKDDLVECLHAMTSSCSVVACHLQPVSALPAALGWHTPTTVILLLRDNTVVASVAVMEEGWRDHHLIESLNDVLSQSNSNRGRAADVDGDSNEGEDNGPTPCTICGRRYLHSHINR